MSHRWRIPLLCAVLVLIYTLDVAAQPACPAPSTAGRFRKVFEPGCLSDATSCPYASFRIPSLIRAETLAGVPVLVAFAEGRFSDDDHGNIDIVAKTSLDNGQTWGALQRIVDSGEDTAGNPTAVWDWTASPRRIVLMYNQTRGWASLRAISDLGVAGRGLRKFHVRRFRVGNDGTILDQSDDPGDVTSSVAEVWRGWDAVGPGNGIVLERDFPGRIVMPAIMRNLVSDDHGTTWTYQQMRVPATTRPDAVNPGIGDWARVPDAHCAGEACAINGYQTATNEASVVELVDGSLLRADRPNNPYNGRYQYWIYRQPMVVGTTHGDFWAWDEDYRHAEDVAVTGHYTGYDASDPSLPYCLDGDRTCAEGYAACDAFHGTLWESLVPWCMSQVLGVTSQGTPNRSQSSIWRYSADVTRIMFAAPKSGLGRRDLAIHTSFNEGESWPHCRVVQPGTSGYSSMTKTSDFRIAVLYERTDATSSGEYPRPCIHDEDIESCFLRTPHAIWFRAYTLNELGALAVP